MQFAGVNRANENKDSHVGQSAPEVCMRDKKFGLFIAASLLSAAAHSQATPSDVVRRSDAVTVTAGANGWKVIAGDVTSAAQLTAQQRSWRGRPFSPCASDDVTGDFRFEASPSSSESGRYGGACLVLEYPRVLVRDEITRVPLTPPQYKPMTCATTEDCLTPGDPKPGKTRFEDGSLYCAALADAGPKVCLTRPGSATNYCNRSVQPPLPNAPTGTLPPLIPFQAGTHPLPCVPGDPVGDPAMPVIWRVYACMAYSGGGMNNYSCGDGDSKTKFISVGPPFPFIGTGR
jgi:hypothetical protein